MHQAPKDDVEHLQRLCTAVLPTKLREAAPSLVQVHTPGFTSTRFRLVGGHGELLGFVKIFRIPEFSEKQLREAVRREYHGLRITSNHLREHPGFHVPQPLAYSLDNHFIVMEYAAGTDLATLALRSLSGAGFLRADRKIQDEFKRVGRLLYLLQDASFRTYAVANPRTERIATYYREMFEKARDECVQTDSTISRHFDELAAEVRPGLARMFAADVEVCYQHHDYRPQNMLVEGRTSLVDFMLFQHGSPYFDLAAFISWVRYLSVWRPWVQRAVRQLEAAFLEGYLAEYRRPVPFAASKLDLMIAVLYPWNYRLFLHRLAGGGRLSGIRKRALESLLPQRMAQRPAF